MRKCKKEYRPLIKALLSLQWRFDKKEKTFDCIATFQDGDFSNRGFSFYKHGLEFAKNDNMNCSEKNGFIKFCEGYLYGLKMQNKEKR